VKGKRGCKIRSFVVDIECACTQFYLSTTPETEERRKKTFFLFLLLFSSDSYKYSFAFDVFIESIMATNQFHAMQCKSFCRIIFFNRSFYPFLVSSLDVVRFCIRLKLNSKLTILFRKELQDFLFPHEYPSETIGIFAFVLRKSVGEINYSDIMSEISVSNQLEFVSHKFL